MYDAESWEELSRDPEWARSHAYRFIVNGQSFVVRVTRTMRRRMDSALLARVVRSHLIQGCRDRWGQGRLIHLGNNEFRYLVVEECGSSDLQRLVQV